MRRLSPPRRESLQRPASLITRCLITCDDDNPGSARVMEKNDFVLGDKVDNVIDGHPIVTRRYWKNL